MCDGLQALWAAQMKVLALWREQFDAVLCTGCSDPSELP